MDEQNRNYNQDGTENDNGYINTEAVNVDSEPQGKTEEAQQKAENDAPWYQSSVANSNGYSSQNAPEQEPNYSPYSSGAGYAYSAQQNTNYSQPTASSGNDKQKSKKKGRKILAAVLAVVVVFCGVFGAFLIKDSKKSDTQISKGQGDAELKISDSTVAATNTSSDGALTPTAIYNKVSPSCVGIILYSTGSSIFSSNSNSSSSSKSNIAGEGSGVIMGENSDSTRTYIITCAHVISGASSSGYKIVVQDKDGNQYDAKIVGYDSKTDIGVLSIEKTGLTAAEFGDSSKLAIGETVYAIGNPGGTEFFGSYTKGMISAIDRPVSNEIGYDMKCIQHDAAINPGNSGGALINSSGQVIGINSSKIASTEYEGMGFAIPITSAKAIIDDLISNGYVTNRPKLGISYAPASNYQQYAMVVQIKGLPSGSLVIAKISDDSSLKGSKAQVGDLITKVDGKDMDSSDVLLEKIEKGKVGDKLTLTLCRINQNYEISEFDVTVTLVEDTGSSEGTTTTTSAFDWNQFFGN